VPSICSLIIGTVQTEHSFVASIAHPKPSSFPEHEPVDEGEERPFKSSSGEAGLLGLAVEDELFNSGGEMGVRTIVQEPCGEGVFH
jgi:hypothetical protein